MPHSVLTCISPVRKSLAKTLVGITAGFGNGRQRSSMNILGSKSRSYTLDIRVISLMGSTTSSYVFTPLPVDIRR